MIEMNFKRIIPYLIAGMPLAASISGTAAQLTSERQPNHYNTITTKTIKNDLFTVVEMVDTHFCEIYSIEHYLDLKAADLCNQYKNNMLAAQNRLAPYLGKHGYVAAVRQELPGAPVGGHCVYGQCTQLQRALSTMGDTVTIVPECASRECIAFKSNMRKKYSDASVYENCIFEGRMYETDSAYTAAMKKYLTRNHATTKESVIKYTKRFDQQNFSVESIEPGSMLIVPRTRGNRQQFHMITYVGRGRIENNQFIPDKNGRPVYTAHNRERIGYLFDTWDTNNVFAANIRQIAHAQYAQELKHIENMPRQKIIEYILSGKNSVNPEQLKQIPISMLQKMARDKYFNNQMPRIQQNNNSTIARNKLTLPLNLMMQYKTNTI